jgi:ribosome modulation factor
MAKRATQKKNRRSKDTEPAPPIGHNGTADVTDDQQQALWFNDHKPKLVALRAKLATATADLRNQYKRLKADLGITRKEAEFALALEKDEKGEELESHRRRMMLARWEGHPIGTQADMFDNVDRTPSVEKAYAAGKRAGLSGARCEPPHDPATEQAQNWIAGWHDGQAVLAKGIQATEPPGEADSAESDQRGSQEPEEPENPGWGESRLPAAAREESNL